MDNTAICNSSRYDIIKLKFSYIERVVLSMDGIIVVNKEKGYTSHDVVYKIKKLFGEKVGHTGTLDPNATGVLPILVGKGTLLSQYLIKHDKKYVATLKLGVKTTTADGEGEIVEERVVKKELLTAENVERVFAGMVGKQMQRPPMYSAIKVKGKKLYEYARTGKSVEIPEREIEIYNLKLLEINNSELCIKFEVYCSKGTYIRSVCEEVAKRLDTVGYMLDLQRTMVGDFTIKDSITVDELQSNFNNKEYIESKVITIEKFFENAPIIKLNEKQLNSFINGVKLNTTHTEKFAKIYSPNNEFIGIAIIQNQKLKREIVL